MENFKRSFKRLLTRLTILGLVVVCGAIAIAQVNKDRAANEFPNLAQPTATLNDVGDSLAALKAVPMPTQETPQWVERQELAQTTDDGALQIVDPNVRATQALQDSRFQEEPMQDAVEVAADRFGTTAAAAADRFGGGLQAPGLLGDDVPAPPENDLTLPAVDPSTREIPDTLAGDFGQQPPASARYGQEIAARPAATQQPTADQYDVGRAVILNYRKLTMLVC